jgi:hypothetical protein
MAAPHRLSFEPESVIHADNIPDHAPLEPRAEHEVRVGTRRWAS